MGIQCPLPPSVDGHPRYFPARFRKSFPCLGHTSPFPPILSCVYSVFSESGAAFSILPSRAYLVRYGASTIRAYRDIFFIKYLHRVHLVIFFKPSQKFTAANQVPADWNQVPFVMIAQQAIMANSDEIFRWNVHQKPADKFTAIQGQFFPYAAVFIVLYPDCHCFPIHMQDTAVADRNPVCVTPQIAHNRLGSCKGFPDIRYPVFSITDVQQYLIFILAVVLGSLTLITKLSCFVQAFQPGQEFPFKKSGHCLPRQKESIFALTPISVLVQSSAGR